MRRSRQYAHVNEGDRSRTSRGTKAHVPNARRRETVRRDRVQTGQYVLLEYYRDPLRERLRKLSVTCEHIMRRTGVVSKFLHSCTFCNT